MEHETIVEVYSRLNHAGYTGTCRAEPLGLRVITEDRSAEMTVDPNRLLVDEVVRLEGTSAPSEEILIFALRTDDERWRGTWCITHGPELAPEDVDVAQALQLGHARRHGQRVN